MSSQIYDRLSDGPAVVGPPPPVIAYSGLIRGGGASAGKQGSSSVSPSGACVAGLFSQAEAWVAKTTPAGSPSLVMNTVLDGVYWDNDDPTILDQDMEAFCVDDDGFIWGQPYQWGTDTNFPIGHRTRGVVGYIDPSNPGHITKRFSWYTSGTASSDDPSRGFYINKMYNFTLADGTIKLIVIPDGGPGPGQYANPLFYECTKGGSIVTHDTGGSWYPLFAFQDDNKDIWLCGSATGSDTTITFQRITSQSTAYTSPQAISGFPSPATAGYPTELRGYFAAQAFIGGYYGDFAGPDGGVCGTLVKAMLDGTATVTSADVTADPLVLPDYPSPADPTYYAIAKHGDCVLGRAAEPGYQSRVFYNLQADLTLGTSYTLDSWGAPDNPDSPSDSYDVYTTIWSEGRQAFIGNRWGYDDNGDVIADLFIYYFGSTPPDGSGDGTSAADSLTVRCWGFSLDGHDFYVLRLGDSGTMVYDLTTGKWSEWESPGRTNWRPHVGQNWVGCASIDTDNGETDVFAGDDATGTLWRLNTKIGRDERTRLQTPPDDKITKVVTGGIQMTGRNTLPCGALTIDLALGNPTQTGASIKMEISGDLGHTWLDCGSIPVTAGNYRTQIEWRSLGLIKAPGRLFKFTDDGATVRLGGANLR